MQYRCKGPPISVQQPSQVVERKVRTLNQMSTSSPYSLIQSVFNKNLFCNFDRVNTFIEPFVVSIIPKSSMNTSFILYFHPIPILGKDIQNLNSTHNTVRQYDRHKQ